MDCQLSVLQETS